MTKMRNFASFFIVALAFRIAYALPTGSNGDCKEDEYYCGPDERACVPLEWACDNVKDCTNGKVIFKGFSRKNHGYEKHYLYLKFLFYLNSSFCKLKQREWSIRKFCAG